MPTNDQASSRIAGQPTPLEIPPSRNMTGAGQFSAREDPGRDYDPYKDGPSALSKAVHLFFFTEILRGWHPYFGRSHGSDI
jgi:hypothetical protein